MSIRINESLNSCPKVGPWTPVQIVRTTCYIGSALAFFDAVRRSGPVGLAEGASAVALALSAWRLRDYQSPKELATIQQKAETQTFSEMMRSHGIKMIVNHKITPDLLKALTEEVASPKFDLHKLIDLPFAELQKFNILTPKEIQSLRQVHAEALYLDDLRAQISRTLDPVEKNHLERELNMREASIRPHLAAELREWIPNRLNQAIALLKIGAENNRQKADYAQGYAERVLGLVERFREAAKIRTDEAERLREAAQSRADEAEHLREVED